MLKPKRNPQVDRYLRDAKTWRKEIEQLRAILLSCQLTEELKWGKPCYTFQESNVVIILPLKNYCTLLFCKGALLKDPGGILIKAGENTQAARQIRLTTLSEITAKAAILKSYIYRAIEVGKAGLEVVYKKITEFALPAELQKQLEKNPALKTAFHALTPGRQRGYIIYFSGAKQAKTRDSRIEKCVPQILQGKGLNDR
jgi:uncharacterized protein YdeI (YjbR/CyaY-like superfamily)